MTTRPCDIASFPKSTRANGKSTSSVLLLTSGMSDQSFILIKKIQTLKSKKLMNSRMFVLI